MDQIYPFNLKAKTPLAINPRTGRAGVLTLYIVEGAANLLKGSRSREECEAALASEPVPGWDVSANESYPSQIFWDGNETIFTVFSFSAVEGYVRIVEC